MNYHPIQNSSSNILRAAFDGKDTLFLEFAATKTRGPKTYEYIRDGKIGGDITADQHWTNLLGVKPYADSLTEEEKATLQPQMKHKIGSEGSYLLQHLVGPYKAPFPNRPLDDEESDAVWSGMEQEAIEAAREEESAYAKESLTAGSQPK